MNRRELLVLIGIATLPRHAAKAQQNNRRHIGVLAQNLEPGLLEALRAGLADLGYLEGKNISIEVCDAAGRSERLPGMANDLLARHVEVIVAINTPAALAAKRATSHVPIVIMRVADPIKSGLIASIAHPGGNVTGMYFMLDELGAKGLELLHEIVPATSRIGILFQADNPGLLSVVSAAETRGGGLGFHFLRLPVSGLDDLPGAFELAQSNGIEALFVVDDGTMTKRRHEVVALAAAHSLPIVSIYKDFAQAGGLLAYGPDLDLFYRHAAYYVDKILKGASPDELPVEQPSKFELMINLKTAESLGLNVPQSLLARADDVIE